MPSYPNPKEQMKMPQVETNEPYLSLTTFCMVVLADEVLESFFETDLPASFHLEPVPLIELPPALSGFLGGLWSNIATDINVKLFHKLSNEVGKTIGTHQVIHHPSSSAISVPVPARALYCVQALSCSNKDNSMVTAVNAQMVASGVVYSRNSSWCL